MSVARVIVVADTHRVVALSGRTWHVIQTGGQGPAGAQGPSGTANPVTWVLADPAIGGVLGPRIPESRTITRVDAYTDTGTVSFNIESRSTIGSPGTNVLASEMAADTNGESVTTGFANAALAAGDWLYLDISGLTGVPAALAVTVTFA